MSRNDLKYKIRRCSVCRSIELPDGTRLPRSQYDIIELKKQGYFFSDLPLSRGCTVKAYGDLGREAVKANPELFPEETCPLDEIVLQEGE